MTKKKVTHDQIAVEDTQPVVVFKQGDEFEVNGKQVKVVEVLEPGRLHCKNKAEPFDSFIVLEEEIETVISPDLLYRPDDRTSL